MDEQRYKIKKDIASRIKMLHVLFTLAVLVFLVYIILFIFCNPKVISGFEEVRDRTIIRAPKSVIGYRGTIYARDGRTLAKSITRTSLIIDFGSERCDNAKTYYKNADTLSRKLAAFFGDKTAKEYYDELVKWRDLTNKEHTYKTLKKKVKKVNAKWWHFRNKDSIVYRTVVDKRKHKERKLFRDVDLAEWNELRTYPILRNGLDVSYRTENIEHRVYPHGDLAIRTIGRIDRKELFGVELAMNDTLAGQNGQQVWQVITPGYSTRINHKNNIKAKNGDDVVTTLDIDVQDAAASALRDQLIAQNAIWGTTIVMECATGDILAMANLRNRDSRCVEEQNYAIEVPMNPGSTFKLVSAMALLENGVPTSQIYNSGLGKDVQVGGKVGATIIDSHPIGTETGGDIDMRTAFAESANVYFTTAVFECFRNNPAAFTDFCYKLHLNKTVGLEDFKAEYRKIRPLDNKHSSRFNALVNMGYGYGLDITPLHTITIYNAVANNGRMISPRLILRTERNGKVLEEAPVRVLNEQICSQSTIDTLRSFMEEVSLTGTAAKYFSEKRCNFRTGAKTGTAQVNTKINGVRYKKEDGYYYGSMVTYLPADNPRYTIMTAIFTKRQSGKAYYGADLAGPVQKQVATYLYNREHKYAKQVEGDKHYISTVKGGNVEKMNTVAEEYGDDHSSKIKKGWGKTSNDNALEFTQLEIDKNCVPNVLGMGLNDALYLLESCGLTVEVSGYGKVVRQSLSAGSEVAKTGKRIKIELK